MSSWIIISLIFIGVFFIISIITPILIFNSYSLSYTKAQEEWEAFRKSLEKEGYEITLMRIENNYSRGYSFYYMQRNKKINKGM